MMRAAGAHAAGGEAVCTSFAKAGFSLLELLVVLAIVAILAVAAYPAYIHDVVRTRRAAAQACLSEYADYMERFRATYMRYDTDADGHANQLPALDCAAADRSGADYRYLLPADSLKSGAYRLQAVPQHAQQRRDVTCATLSIDQSGVRSASGRGGAAECW